MNHLIAIAAFGLVVGLAVAAPPAAATHVFIETAHYLADWTIDNTFCWTFHECGGSWQFVPMGGDPLPAEYS